MNEKLDQFFLSRGPSRDFVIWVARTNGPTAGRTDGTVSRNLALLLL